MNVEPKKRGSFWTSLPGIISGVAGVIAAVGTVLAILAGNGLWPFRPATPGPPAALTATPSNHTFDPVQKGNDSDSFAFTVTNPRTDAVPLNVSVAGDGASSFEIKQETCSVAPLSPKGTCDLQLIFSPQVEGPLYAKLVVAPLDGGGAAQISLSGTGLPPGLLSFNPATVRLAIYTLTNPVKPNTSTDVTITNSGLIKVTINAVQVADTGHFSASPACNTRVLNVGQWCTVTVTFTSTADGTFNTTLQVHDDGPGGMHTVNVSGYRGFPTIKFPTMRPPITPRPSP